MSNAVKEEAMLSLDNADRHLYIGSIITNAHTMLLLYWHISQGKKNHI